MRRASARSLLIGLALLALLALPGALGIGLTPASTNVDYKAGAVVTGQIKVIGNGKMFLSSSDPRLVLDKNYVDGTSVVSYTISMQNFDPGPTTILISATQVGSGGMISSQAQVTAKVVVMRAVTGRYLTAQVFPPKEGASSFYVKVANKGTEDLADVMATIDVTDDGGTLSQRFSSAPRPLNAGDQAILEVPAILKDGAYHYTATITYDGDVKTVEGDFTLGKPDVAYDGFVVNSFTLGSIGEFVVTLDNRFDRPVLTNLTVGLSQGGMLIDRFAQQALLPAGAQRALSAYLNTQRAVKGPATLTVEVSYAGTTNTHDVPVTLTDNQVLAAGQVTNSGGRGVNIVLLLVLAGIVFNSVLIFVLLRRRNA